MTTEIQRLARRYARLRRDISEADDQSVNRSLPAELRQTMRDALDLYNTEADDVETAILLARAQSGEDAAIQCAYLCNAVDAIREHGFQGQELARRIALADAAARSIFGQMIEDNGPMLAEHAPELVTNYHLWERDRGDRRVQGAAS